MKTRIVSALLAASLLLPVPALHAAEESGFGGTLTLRLLVLDEDDQSAKFQEYRDLRDGVSVDIDLRHAQGAYHQEFTGRNLGLEDQTFKLGGGSYDRFKYKLFFSETPHNYSFGARTFFAGVGSADLDYAAVNRAKDTDARLTPNVSTDIADWNSFDYAVSRKQYGGGVEVSALRPFYVKVGAKREERTGTKPLGADSAVFADIIGNQGSSFGNVVEMPEPIDYVTTTATVEAGYRTRPMSLKVTGVASSFDNENEILTWRNPFVTTERVVETNYLAPENEYWKIGGQGVFRLPARSTLSLGASFARLSDELNLGKTVVDSTAAPAGGLSAANSPDYGTTTLGLNRSTFDGEIDYTTARAALDTGALAPLSLTVRYDYTGRKNHSNTIEYTNLSTGDTIESHLLEYDQNRASVDLGLKLPRSTSLALAYEFRDVSREEREDAEQTTDHSVAVKLRNAYSDTVEGRLQYQHLFRSSDFVDHDAPLTDVTSIEQFVRRFDVADKDRDRVLVGVDLAPLSMLELSLEYAYSRDDYDETALGRLEEERHEALADLSLELPRGVVLGASVGYEYVVSDQAQRQLNPGDITDPAAGNTGNAFNWTEQLKSDLWSYGLSAKVPLVAQKLALAASWYYQKSDGEGIFGSSKTALLDLDASDDYTLRALDVRATWKAARQLEFILGYLHEKFEYSDTQWEGYTYTSRTSFLTGAYADEDYNVHVGYLLTRFTF